MSFKQYWLLYPVTQLTFSYFITIRLLYIHISGTIVLLIEFIYIFMHCVIMFESLYLFSLYLVDPGYVHKNTNKDTNSSSDNHSLGIESSNLNEFIDQNDSSNTDKWMSCNECHLKKPPRAEHCPQCNKCILRFVMHDDFFSNCIGLYNYKFYILYHALDILNALICALVAVGISFLVKEYRMQIYMYCGISFLLSMFRLVIDIKKLLPHLLLLVRNETMLEANEINNAMAEKTIKKGVFQEGLLSKPSLLDYLKSFDIEPKRSVLNPYNVSAYANFKLIFGDGILDWFSTFYSYKGTGYTYEKNRYYQIYGREK